jgi:alpha-amylase/alpha-mannosidase (GH57 family)
MNNRIPLLMAGALLVPALCLGAAHRPTAGKSGVTFTLMAPEAREVYIAGDFNGWHPSRDSMSKDETGTWTITIPLKPGRYEYKYVLNDGEIWKHDTTNPLWADDTYGGRNSVLIINQDGSLNFSRRSGSIGYAPVAGSLKAYGKPLHIAMLWHQHQPRYFKDEETGEYLEPWVRIHGIKDYYDMAAMLYRYPEMKFTINLTPVLLMQIEEIVESYYLWKRAGSTGPIPGCDRWVRLTLEPPDRLTREDKAFILRNFFRMPRETMIEPHERFSELASKKIGDSDEEIDRTIAAFTDADWRDLQAWFNLAEFDPDFRTGEVTLPDGQVVTVRRLVKKQRGFTEADKAEIIETQMKILKNIIPLHRELAREGRLELITSPYYHPILPLLCNTGVAREASPALTLPDPGFAYPQDARTQLEMAIDYYSDTFGALPRGIWPSEGAVSEALIPILGEFDIKWIATDEGVLAKSLGEPSLNFDQKYRAYKVGRDGAELAVFFRDHNLSDDIGFRYSKMDGVEAANDMMRMLHRIHRATQAFDGDFVVPIILDGENAWEHFEDDGKTFLNSLYYQISESEWLVPVTMSGYLEEFPPARTLPHLAPGSWIGANFDTWIGEDEENTAWVYLAEARRAVEDARDRIPPRAVELALSEIYAAEGSDWFWWYGLDQNMGDDMVFDAAFRGTLGRAYARLGIDPPGYLEIPIVSPESLEPARVMTGHISPEIDGAVQPKDEWAGAALLDDSEGGAMARSEGELIRKLCYGYDNENLYIRIDPGRKSAKNCELAIYISGRPGVTSNSRTRRRAEAPARGLGFSIGWEGLYVLGGGSGTATFSRSIGQEGWVPVFEAPTAYGEVLEMAIPFDRLGVASGEDLKFAVLGYCDDRQVDMVPSRGILSFRVPALAGTEVLASMSDVIGDDYGPGYYKYPTDPVFLPGSFDITSLDIMLEEGGKVIFKLGVAGGLHSPWGGITGYSLQAVDIYIDTDGIEGSGARKLYTARKAETVPEHAWEYYVRACMDTVALYEGNRRRDEVGVKSYVDGMTSSILVEFPLEAIKGGKDWNVIVALLGHDGYSKGQIRPVQADAGQWVFGGCDQPDLCPAIIDLVVGEGVSQEEVLSSYRKTGRLSRIPGFRVTLP